ncbi:MAG TPA: tyrosine-protein phosphatase [Candidatus Binataceae bacterium]|nr:tyrosine-protein phosphatase [Candidatus Binataceae bacterium]
MGGLSREGSPKKGLLQPRVVVDFDIIRRIGGLNFRDLGGHPTQDGRRIRHGMVYRSAHLAHLNTEGAHPLESIRLRTLITLQSRLEVRHLGKPKPEFLESGVRWEHIPIGDTWFREEGFYKIETKPGDEHLVILTEFLSDWQNFFRILADRNVYPLLFHCSAGRDRTGVGAALLLELLGVSRDRIVTDFLVSNETFPNIPLGERQLTPIFGMIDENGGIEGFMHEVLGLDPSDLEAIRADLLEPAE